MYESKENTNKPAKRALIIYYTRTGHTREAAEHIAKGLQIHNVNVTLCEVQKVDPTLIKGYDIVLVGSPTHALRPARAIRKFLSELPAHMLRGTICGSFAVMARFGGDKVVAWINSELQRLGGKVVEGSPIVKAGSALSLWVGPHASLEAVANCVNYGKKVGSCCVA
jgi:flavodoxin